MKLPMKRVKLAVTFILNGLLMMSASGQSIQSYFFNANGVNLHYKSGGTGEPVILIHGFSDNIEICFQEPLQPSGTDFMATLAKDYRVIAVDARGHGLSDKPLEPGSYGKIMEDDIIGLMNHLNVEKAHIVGYSMGAFIAGNLLVDHKERVKSVVLIGATPLTNQQFFEGHPLSQIFEATAHSLANGRGISPLLRYFWPDNEPAPSEARLERLNNQLLEGQNTVALKSCLLGFKDLLRIDENELKNSKIPIAIIMGSDDPLNEYLDPFQKLKASSLVTVPDANHFDILLYPECLNAVEEFLQAQNSSSNTFNTNK